ANWIKEQSMHYVDDGYHENNASNVLCTENDWIVTAVNSYNISHDYLLDLCDYVTLSMFLIHKGTGMYRSTGRGLKIKVGNYQSENVTRP
ncbi:8808_t:CDS:1, partial [Acaulospora morrowiae]